MNVEQIKAELKAIFKKHGLGHAIIIFRDDQSSGMATFASSPIDTIAVSVLSQILNRAITDSKDIVATAVKDYEASL